MKTTLWMSWLLLVLGGCSTHTPAPAPAVIKPIEPPKALDTNQSALNDPFCCMLPQDLELKLPEYGPKVNDLERFEQLMAPYVEQSGIDRDSLYEIQKTFEGRYFSPWGYVATPQKVEEVLWPLRAFRGGFGSNLRPVPPVWFEEIKQQSNFASYGTINKKAITLKWMDIRAFPTDKPLYKNPALPGEGYPFDLLQNSSVNYNEPIFISHTSKDGAWSYIFSNNVSGWVKSDGVALIDDETALKIQKSEKVFLIEDNVALLDSANRFSGYSRVGMVLPLERSDDENYYVKAIDANNSIKILSLPKRSAHIGVSRFNKSDLNAIGTQLLKNTYGWGGMYGERDCSSMIRDMMTPFGIWLPRNSSAQSRKGEVVSFIGMNDDEKLSLIKEKGIPFETIIYLKGHVLLYVGTYQESVMVMHNIWGIRTIDKQGNRGRHVIGKAVISTLELGSDLNDFDPAMKLLSRVESMNIFTQTPTSLSRNTKVTLKKKSL
ncbi:SH3 domain-containing C40 family peptidase [Sulfuricurvum sp.]|uniref:SH3 domain-containing C40 family peptidase n=1 Tax=Sulfuricurvum sp. TaxID=2025608 RepID=UPI00262350E3|nr:SH3 domain-containing C40 family peptidase [Sulfuricurvum sp.]MDD2780555.1 SH3 domain-containing protein [Sulfuricurvum sp.]